MRWDNFCRRVGWLFTVVLVLVTGRLTVADDQQDQLGKARAAYDRAIVSHGRAIAAHRRASAYWLGIGCTPVSDALRAQLKLPENQGIVVHSVSPESPAAGAGIEKYDVLLSVGDKPLVTVADLSQAVADAKGEQELKIDLLRRGEALTVTVKPNKRPERPQRDLDVDVETIIAPESDAVRTWLDKIRLRPGQFSDFPRRLRIYLPGTVIEKTFPDDLSVHITKDGQQPAKVVVKQGDEKWEVTEDALDELPETVRGHVQGLLGRVAVRDFAKIITGEVERQLKDVTPPRIPEIPPLPIGPLQEQFERSLDQINEQLENLRDALKDLGLDRPETEEEEEVDNDDGDNSA